MATTIVIFTKQLEYDLDTGLQVNWGLTLWVSDGVTNYMQNWSAPPETANLQTYVNGLAVDILAAAVASGQIATAAQNAHAEFLLFLTNNSGATQLFTVTELVLETAINDLVDTILPLASAANRTKLKRLLQVGALLDREQVVK